MKINKMGLNYTHGERFAIDRPLGSGDFLFLHMKTSAIVIINGKEVVTNKNSILLFNRGTPQIYKVHGSSYSNDFIHFDAEIDRDLRQFPLDTVLLLPSSKQIAKILKDIYLEYISNNKNKEESLDLLMKLLFVKISELITYHPENPALSGYYDTLLQLRSAIYRHPEEKWSVARLSHEASLSPSHFQRLYKQTFGVTCIADVIACKIEYAKVSLASTGTTIREIAALCGYENEEHFMRQFKRIVGITPTEYRRLQGAEIKFCT
jgi:AraC family transcriptional regulator of arabinose operon